MDTYHAAFWSDLSYSSSDEEDRYTFAIQHSAWSGEWHAGLVKHWDWLPLRWPTWSVIMKEPEKICCYATCQWEKGAIISWWYWLWSLRCVWGFCDYGWSWLIFNISEGNPSHLMCSEGDTPNVSLGTGRWKYQQEEMTGLWPCLIWNTKNAATLSYCTTVSCQVGWCAQPIRLSCITWRSS
jgi:hypothetical protein